MFLRPTTIARHSSPKLIGYNTLKQVRAVKLK